MSDWQTCQFPGVRFREHPSRKLNGKPDKYFTIRFRANGKRQEKSLGWTSEGWTPAKANAEMVSRTQGSGSAPKLDEPAQTTTEQAVPPSPPQTQPPRTNFQFVADLFLD